MNVGVGEHLADLLEEQVHEVVRGVQDGVDRPEGARGSGAGVTRRQQVLLSWWGEAVCGGCAF